MEVLDLECGVDEFWFNFSTLLNSSQLPLPSTTLSYRCSCGDILRLFPRGDHYYEETFKSYHDMINIEKQRLFTNHKVHKNCEELYLEKELIPENLLFMTKYNKMEHVIPINIEEIIFHAVLCVMKSESTALVLYQREDSDSNILTKLIKHNFSSILNVTTDQNSNLEDLIDDDDVHQKQQSLPRLTGGGRRMLQEFKYVCQWCSPEELSKKTRGRFREIKNYRDHFRKHHQDHP